MTSKLGTTTADRVMYAGALRDIPGLETRATALDQPPMVVRHELPLDLATTGVELPTGTATILADAALAARFSSDGLKRTQMVPFAALIMSARIGWVSGTIAPTATWAATVKIGTPANASKFAVAAVVATSLIGDGTVQAITSTQIFDSTIDADEVVVFKTSVNGTAAKMVSVSLVIIPRDPSVTA